MDSESHGAGTEPETASPEHASPGLALGPTGDRCVSCGAPLSSDQRYCVVCGERRGAPRFTLPPSAPAERREPETVSPARGGRASRGGLGVGFTLIAGVATLLLAMLVGVLIGHNTAKSTPVADNGGAVKVITVNAGSSAPSPASTTASGTATTPHTTTHHHVSKVTPKAAKKQAKAEQGAASKVTGGSGAPPPTTKVGQKGKGAGFNKKTHKFDGSFFGQ